MFFVKYAEFGFNIDLTPKAGVKLVNTDLYFPAQFCKGGYPIQQLKTDRFLRRGR